MKALLWNTLLHAPARNVKSNPTKPTLFAGESPVGDLGCVGCVVGGERMSTVWFGLFSGNGGVHCQIVQQILLSH